MSIDWSRGAFGWAELGPMLRKARLQTSSPERIAVWTTKRLAAHLDLYRIGQPQEVDPVLLAILEKLKDQGADKLSWTAGSLRNAETGRYPIGRELVLLYDHLFNNADGSLTQFRNNIVLNAHPKSMGTPRPPGRPLIGDNTQYICDLTIRDGIVVPPGLEMLKSWRILNCGTVPWIGRRLGRVGGITHPVTITSPPWVTVPETAPGEMVDIAVPVQAPTLPTSQVEARWKFVDTDGMPYFPNVEYGVGMLIGTAWHAKPPRPEDIELAGRDEETAAALERFREQGVMH